MCSKVGMTRIFTIAGSRLQKVLEELEAVRLAFLRVELRAKNLALADNGWDAAIAWGCREYGFINGGEIVPVDEIEIAAGRHILQEPASAFILDRIPTHVGDAFSGRCFFKLPDIALDQAKAKRRFIFMSRIRQKLHSKADAKYWSLSANYGVKNRIC